MGNHTKREKRLIRYEYHKQIGQFILVNNGEKFSVPDCYCYRDLVLEEPTNWADIYPKVSGVVRCPTCDISETCNSGTQIRLLNEINKLMRLVNSKNDIILDELRPKTVLPPKTSPILIRGG